MLFWHWSPKISVPMSNWAKSIPLTHFGCFIVQLSASRTEAPTCQSATFNIPLNQLPIQSLLKLVSKIENQIQRIQTKICQQYIDSSTFIMFTSQCDWVSTFCVWVKENKLRYLCLNLYLCLRLGYVWVEGLPTGKQGQMNDKFINGRSSNGSY